MNEVVLFLAFILLAVGLLYFVNRPKKMLLWLISFYPVISIFWFVKFSGFSMIDFVFGGVILIFGLSFLTKSKQRKWRFGKFGSLFFIVFLALLIPTYKVIISGQMGIALDFNSKILFGFISYAMVKNLFSWDDRWIIIKHILIALCLVVVIVTFQLLTGIGTGYSDFSYLTGLYADEGNLSRLALYGIIFSLPMAGHLWQKKYKLPFLFLTIFSVMMLGMAVSRNAILAAIFIFIFYAIFKRKIGFMLLAGAIVIAFMTNSSVIEKNLERKINKEIRYMEGDKIDIRTLGSGRIGRWQRVVDEFNEADTFTQVFGSGKGIGPHGQFFDLLRRTGLFGLIVIIFFYLRLLFFAFKKFWQDTRDPFPFYSFLLLIVFWILFLGEVPLYNFYLQILIFAFVALLEKKPGLIKHSARMRFFRVK